MPKLPEDVIADITVRLPVKSLVRFKGVSNTWRSMIEDPDFVKLHLQHSLKTGSNHYLMLKSYHLYTVDFDSLNAAMGMDHHPLYTWADSLTEAIGCCNGLVLLRNTEQDMALYNFSTRMYHRLPVEPIATFERVLCDPRYVFYGFGYDFVNDDYKVVRVVLGLYPEDDPEVGVYSLKSDSWRRLKTLPVGIRWLYSPSYYLFSGYRCFGVLVGNALHWVSPLNPEIGSPYLIVAFGLGSEEFHMVPQPDYEYEMFEMDLSVLGGCLCVLCNDKVSWVDVWLMKEYGVKESWSKLFRVEQPGVQLLKALAYSKKGNEVLFVKDDRKIVWYDPKRKRTRRVRIAGVPVPLCAEFCIGSLVPLSNSDGKEKVEQEKNKKQDEIHE
ncbi:putative F-box and associated interaction domains-containing protein [Tripterygium wilfordii]|uniref:Putative F-box and associated interaction domains-containing protein n=1 Tax=Tripterygium wilfordii TaxID=458696 RepID=A0A7J7DSQ6_TRIWF|nr:F-box protein CPR1-like [Tripterygium wilfordii]KAF5749395.1 putative F-box and associated interaction domains-containing protein [Tripterygium wilfordii]